MSVSNVEAQYISSLLLPLKKGLCTCCRTKRLRCWTHCLAVTQEAEIPLQKVQALLSKNGNFAPAFQRLLATQVYTQHDLDMIGFAVTLTNEVPASHLLTSLLLQRGGCFS